MTAKAYPPRRGTHVDVGPRTYRGGHERGHPVDLRRPGPWAEPGDLRRGRPGDRRGQPRGRRDHRDRGGEGPGRRGGRAVPDPGAPRPAAPAVHPGTDGHHRRDAPRRSPAVGGPARVPGVRPRSRAGGPQRSLRRELPQGRLRTPGHDLAGSSHPGHRPAGPARPDPRRGPQLQARHARPALPDPGDPQPPRPGRCAGDRRRPARADGTGRQPRGAHPHRAAGVQQSRARRAPAQAWPGRWAARRAGGLRVRGLAGGGALRGHLPLDPQAGPELLHGRRAAPPDDRDGRPGDQGGGRAVRHAAGGPGARAAHHRRPRTEVQQALDTTAERRVAQAHRGAVPTGERGQQGPRRRRARCALHRAVHEPPDGRGRRGGARRGPPAADVLPVPVEPSEGLRLRPGRPRPMPGALHRGRHPGGVRRHRRTCAGGAGQRPGRGRGGPHSPHGRPCRAGALRGGRCVARPSQRPAAWRGHGHHQRRPRADPPDRRRPSRPTTAGGRSTSSATAVWPLRA